MKKALGALVVLAGAVAFAQVDATEVGPALKDEAKEVKQGAKQNWKEWKQQAGLATEDRGTFKAAQAFRIEGTVEKAGREEITLARPGLPPAVLDIRDQTRVKVDGRKADAGALREGARVKAQFQLEGEETVAVSIDATSKAPAKERAVGGAGAEGRGAKQEAKQEWDEQREGAEKAAKEAEKDADREMESLKKSGDR